MPSGFCQDDAPSVKIDERVYMRRGRRFPLKSLILVLAIAGSVGYVIHMDVDIPKMALTQIGDAVSNLGTSLRLMADSAAEGGIVFVDTTAAPLATTQSEPEVQVAGIPILVNADHPVEDDYTPDDLVNMREYCDADIVYIKGSEIEGTRGAVDALLVMLGAAIDDGVSNWQISAGYRSVAYQQRVWDNKVYEYRQQGLSGSQAQSATAKYVAKPGCSEHHTGLAFDVTVPGQSFPLTQQSKWLAENCWRYGFIIRYTEEKEAITGISAEPWHVRYVGQPHATIMHQYNWCLEEYIDSLS